MSAATSISGDRRSRCSAQALSLPLLHDNAIRCILKHTGLCLLLAVGIAHAQEPPSAEAQQRVLRTVTSFAQGYLDRIPNFTCIRTTKHMVAPAATHRWHEEATVAYELSYYGRDERYRLLTADGVPVKKVPRSSTAEGWLEMNGNFGWILKELFAPGVHPHFQWDGWQMVQGKRGMVFSYRIALAESHATQSICAGRLFFTSCKDKNYGFHGLLFIDAASLDILRISDTPEDLPPNYAQGISTVDYGRVTVAGSEYLLPIADSIETYNGKILFRNDSTYTDYRRFTSESTLKTDAP